MLKHSSVSVSVGSLGPSVHKVCSSHLSISGGEGVLILNVILPLLPSCWDFSFALGCVISFLGGTQHSPVYGVQQPVVVLEFSQEKKSMSSTP